MRENCADKVKNRDCRRVSSRYVQSSFLRAIKAGGSASAGQSSATKCFLFTARECQCQWAGPVLEGLKLQHVASGERVECRLNRFGSPEGTAGIKHFCLQDFASMPPNGLHALLGDISSTIIVPSSFPVLSGTLRHNRLRANHLSSSASEFLTLAIVSG